MKKIYFTIILLFTLALTASAQVPESMQLRNIILDGGLDEYYTISNTLVGVYVPPRYKNVVYAKDKNNGTSVSYSTPSDDQIESGKIFDNKNDFSQSNWIKIYFPEGYDASSFAGKEIKAGSVTGQFHVANTPAGPVGLFVDVDVTVNGEHVSLPITTVDNVYTYNTYCTCNFVQQPEWFLVKPKNLEVAKIRWAVYKGSGEFIVPKRNGDVNGYNLPGSFTVDMTMWEAAENVDPDDVFSVGYIYEFPALIEFSTGNNVSLNIDPGFDGDINYAPAHTPGDVVEYADNSFVGINRAPMREGESGFEFGEPGSLPEGYHATVFPLRLETPGVITAVEQVEVERTVSSVTYVDIQGRVTKNPAEGMCIEVTRYTDGTTSTKKVVK